METTKTGWLGWFGDELIEYGGNIPNIQRTIKKLQENKEAGGLLKNKKAYVLFVFSGQEFLKQLENDRDGGYIYARWLHYAKNVSINRCHFVANNFDGKEIKEIELEKRILDGIKMANERYRVIFGNAAIKRYDDTFFQSPYFHCINAEDEGQVKKMFADIKQTKPL